VSEHPEPQPEPSADGERSSLEILAEYNATMQEAMSALVAEQLIPVAAQMVAQLAVFRDAAGRVGFSQEFAEWFARSWAEQTTMIPEQKHTVTFATPVTQYQFHAHFEPDEDEDEDVDA
jgi:hypothetical protein